MIETAVESSLRRGRRTASTEHTDAVRAVSGTEKHRSRAPRLSSAPWAHPRAGKNVGTGRAAGVNHSGPGWRMKKPSSRTLWVCNPKSPGRWERIMPAGDETKQTPVTPAGLREVFRGTSAGRALWLYLKGMDAACSHCNAGRTNSEHPARHRKPQDRSNLPRGRGVQ